jgi:hypothetical protein
VQQIHEPQGNPDNKYFFIGHIDAAELVGGGKLRRRAPRMAKLPVSRIMPIINPVMAADARGASRRGRYPTRSMNIPTKDVKNMEKRMVRMRMSQPGRGMPVRATNPSRAGKVEQHQDAVHHGISQGDQGIEAAPLQTVYNVLEKEVHFIIQFFKRR